MNQTAVHRIRLDLHYDGSAFYGWQLQPGARTVQGEIERVASRLFDVPTRVIGSGRTDRGVHATGQVAALETPISWTPDALRRSMNALLPCDIWVAEAALAPPSFHPRFQATARSYEYRIGLMEETASPFHSRWCWRPKHPPELDPMTQAADSLVGDHSFHAFAKTGQEERGDRCIVTEAGFTPWDDLGLRFRITANRFLHHMVRYLVGTLVAIGSRERPEQDLFRLLAGAPGLKSSPPAPARGLFLTRVTYEAGAIAYPDAEQP
jgi:tRNA pseudouridine38-40 synthase